MSKHTDELLDAVQEIAELIWMEASLSAQDRWLQNIIDMGIWKPDPEMVEGMKVEGMHQTTPLHQTTTCTKQFQEGISSGEGINLEGIVRKAFI